LTSFSQKSSHNNRFLLYGDIPYTQSKAMEFVADKWNIQFYHIPSSFASQKIRDSVERENNSLWLKMDTINGPNSYSRFRKNFSNEFKNIQKAYDLFESNRSIKKIQEKIKQNNEDFLSDLNKSNGNGKYYWILYALNKEKYPKKLWQPQYEIEVDIKTLKCKILLIK